MKAGNHAVLIVGAGPTGLTLAGELALAGVDVGVIERRDTPELAGSRAGGLHSRTLEMLDQRGIAERFIAQGQKYPMVHFNLIALDIGDFPSRHNYVLGLWQAHIERILAEWVTGLRVPIYRGVEARGLRQDDGGVDVDIGGRQLRAQYLVGCDGGRSAIRKAAAIEFPGWDPTLSWLIAEVRTRDEPAWGFRHDVTGIHGIGKTDEGGWARIVLTERELPGDREPTLRDLSEALVAIYGTDFGAHSPRWISRFNDVTRQAAAYRRQRVLLAGDAAHVHPPVGGQGLNIGVQDAMNLGWKLAQVIRGASPDSWLDSYHAERHPVAARVLRNTMAQVALRHTDDRSRALQEIFAELLALGDARRKIAAMMSGLDVSYVADDPSRHPLIGRRMPDLDLVVDGASRRLYSLLHEARPVLLALGDVPVDHRGWDQRIRWVRAEARQPMELPVIGTVPPPASVLVRPDGYVGWAGSGSEVVDRIATTLSLSSPGSAH